MNYVFRYFYDPACYTLINEVTEWIECNSLQDEIDKYKSVSLEHSISGAPEDYVIFGCKTEESYVAFKLRWE